MNKNFGSNIISPMFLAGLFHRCISQGGHPLNFWSMMKPGQSREYAWQLGKVLGCSNYVNKTSETLLQCLKSKSIEELIVSTLELVVNILFVESRRVKVDNTVQPGKSVAVAIEFVETSSTFQYTYLLDQYLT